VNHANPTPAARAASIISLTWAGLVLKVRSGGTPAAAQRAGSNATSLSDRSLL
jgi:hypothetical protein